jgi:hypothetical protein
LKTKPPFCLNVLEMCDDDVPLFTEEAFRHYKANQSRLPLACRSDDDDDVPLFGEKVRAKHAASHHVTGMSDDDNDIPLFDEKARAKHAASLHATGMSVDEVTLR